MIKEDDDEGLCGIVGEYEAGYIERNLYMGEKDKKFLNLNIYEGN